MSNYLESVIERLDNELGTLKKVLIQYEELEKKQHSSYGILMGNPIFELKNRIQKGIGLRQVLVWWPTVTGGKHDRPISNYFRISLTESGFRFSLISEIEEELYYNVCSSHSDLFVETDRRFKEFIKPFLMKTVDGMDHNLITDLTYHMNLLTDKDDNKFGINIDQVVGKIQSEVEEILLRLTDERIQNEIKLLETIIDNLIKFRKRRLLLNSYVC